MVGRQKINTKPTKHVVVEEDIANYIRGISSRFGDSDSGRIRTLIQDNKRNVESRE